MSKTSNALLRTKTVRGKDLEGKTHTLVKTLPQQLQLFQTFLPDDDERYSNTIELYDAIPKYFTNPRAIPTVSLSVTCAVVYTYGCDDGRIAPTRCAIIAAGLDGR